MALIAETTRSSRPTLREQTPVTVRLSQFEGPLDLLLHLIDQARIDIRDIFVSQITEQYLATLDQDDEPYETDMDTASSFLSMAATLLEIKSRALLPRPPSPEPDEDEVQAELVRQLEAHRALKLRADSLRAREYETLDEFSKLPEECPPVDPDFIWTNLTIGSLTAAWMRLLQRAAEREDARERLHAPHRILPRDNVTVESFMLRITRRLWLAGGGNAMPFAALFGVRPSKAMLVTGFLAMLELMRLGKVTARQGDAFAPIVIEFAEGFDYDDFNESGELEGSIFTQAL